MRSTVLAITLMASSASSIASPADEKPGNLLAYREADDGSLTILRGQPGPRCATDLFAMHHIQPSEEMVHGCWAFAKHGHVLIFYGPGYRRQMLMKMRDFRAGPAYRGKYPELRD